MCHPWHWTILPWEVCLAQHLGCPCHCSLTPVSGTQQGEHHMHIQQMFSLPDCWWGLISVLQHTCGTPHLCVRGTQLTALGQLLVYTLALIVPT